MSTLTRTEFDVLAELAEAASPLSQRELAARCKKSLGTINKTIALLSDRGLIESGRITSAGYEALEPYRVRRAVFIAAGLGSRLIPISLNTPKPLVRVNGKRMIDTVLDAVVAAGIEEIVIVRGYLGEQFDQLLSKYPMIRFMESHAYMESNNISSAVCVRHLLANAYMLEADLVLYNPRLIRRYHYCSNFLGIPRDRTDDWCFTARKGIITSQQVGGLNCYQEVGISYWTEADAAKLEQHILQTYEMPGGKERYWDQVPFVFFPDSYQVEIRECSPEDVVEIDTFNELKAIDKIYDC